MQARKSSKDIMTQPSGQLSRKGPSYLTRQRCLLLLHFAIRSFRREIDFGRHTPLPVVEFEGRERPKLQPESSSPGIFFGTEVNDFLGLQSDLTPHRPCMRFATWPCSSCEPRSMIFESRMQQPALGADNGSYWHNVAYIPLKPQSERAAWRLYLLSWCQTSMHLIHMTARQHAGTNLSAQLGVG